MIRHDVPELLEPEQQKLRQHTPFAGNRCRQHGIESPEPAGLNDQQPVVTERINVPHLASMQERQAPDVRLEERCVTHRAIARAGCRSKSGQSLARTASAFASASSAWVPSTV